MESKESGEEGRSLEETPTWAVASVISFLIIAGALLHTCLKKFGKWLNKNERKPLLSSLEKVKDELMIFGLLSLLLGHWAVYVAKICVHSSALASRFYPCAPGTAVPKRPPFVHNHFVSIRIEEESSNASFSSNLHMAHGHHHNPCPEGHQPLASYHSLEQLHRFLFVLGTTHVVYSFAAVALAVVRIFSWRLWENYAKVMAESEEHDKVKHLTSFVSNHTSHPWSRHTILVWLFCFFRQFWCFIDEADYLSLRQGFITTHQLPLLYNFHNYMFRSMEEEFQYVLGISIPLWIFTILCVLLGFHGTNIYFWLSFCPAILVLLIGTKLHVVIVKLAGDIADKKPHDGVCQYNTKDELFWFGNPRLILQLIHFVTFQNSLEMAMYLWSLWEIQGPSCFTENHTFIVIRLTFGLVTQFWCSFITFPLYVIVAQMGSKYKKFIISHNVRKSIHGWRNKASSRSDESKRSSTSLESLLYGEDIIPRLPSLSSSSLLERYSFDRYMSSSNNRLDPFNDHSVQDRATNVITR